MEYEFIAGLRIFQGCSIAQIKEILSCVQCKVTTFSKGEIILQLGQQIEHLGIVLKGSATIESPDPWGNNTILDCVGKGQVFAETYACLPQQPLLVNVVAAETTQILFLSVQKLLHPCSCNCAAHSIVTRNLLTICSQKNLNLSRKIFHTGSKSIRGRVLSYLSFQSIQQKSTSFSIPFNRQQLADYLGVDRSALSHELSKMQIEGLISFQKNQFVLHPSFESTLL